MSKRGGWYMVAPGGPVAFSSRVSLTEKLSAWRWRRSNLRRADDQRKSGAEIAQWLPDVLGEDGSAEAVEHLFELDTVDVDILWRGVPRCLSFGLLVAWPNIARRDTIAAAIRDALDDDDERLVDVPLTAIAEDEWLDRGEWRSREQ